MKIVMAGASGLIGSELVSFFQEQGDNVVILVRNASREKNEYFWNPEKEVLDASLLEGVDVVINLAGENIANGWWTEAKKKRIRESRLQTTQTIAKTISGLHNPPKVWLNASAVGFYGDCGDEILTEDSSNGKGFLANVCLEWEAVAKANASTRIICLRTGIVLASEGGILKRLWLPFKLGLGGLIGSGKQYMSWIAIQDFIGAIAHLIQHDVSGPVNMTAPNPVTNFTFTKTLGKVLNRATFLPLPAFLAKAMFGEMAEEMLLSSIRALPKKLEQSRFSFKYSELENAFQELLGDN